MRKLKKLYIVLIALSFLFSCGKRNDYRRISEIRSGWNYYGEQNPSDMDRTVELKPAAENISLEKGEILRAGWYRKTFMLENQDTLKSIYLVFEGLFTNPSLFVNGHLLEDYNEKEDIQVYKVSDRIFSGQNTIDLQIDSTFTGLSNNHTEASLVIAPPIHIIPEGLNLKASVIDSAGFRLEISVMLQNDTRNMANIKVISHIYHPSQGRIAVINSDGIELNDELNINQLTEVDNYDPLKTLEYECVTDILSSGNTILDTYVEEFIVCSSEK